MTTEFIASPEALAGLKRIQVDARRRFLPPPKLSVSQWADTYRRLSSVDSAEPGRWETSTAEYQRECLDAFSDPLVQDIILEFAAQTGKTAILLNCEGYVIANDPGPILHVLPSKDDAQEFSKDRFSAGLIDATPSLQGRVLDVKSGAAKEKSTLDHKRFPGGRLTFAWSNSPSRLSSRPIRFVICDEIDKFVPHPVQGDPVERARKRSATYRGRRKHIWAGTPTLAGEPGEGGSAIDSMYRKSSRGHFVVACPECATEGVLGFFADSRGVEPASGFHLAWDKDPEGNHLPDSAHVICHACGAIVEESSKSEMVRHGRWIHEDPNNRARGFHVSAMVSPWSTWSELAAKFLAAGHNSEKLRIFWNEDLGEPWEIRGEQVSDRVLINRREAYPAACPAGIAVLTAGADVQVDRIEVGVLGWAPGYERWAVDYQILLGDPNEDEVWADLDGMLQLRYEHESGTTLPIACTLIDSAGHHTQRVYNFCHGRWDSRHIAPCIGRANTPGVIRPLLSKPTRLQNGVELFSVGVDAAKEFLMRSLGVARPGPGYAHFPVADWCDEKYFGQLCSEKLVVKRKGFNHQKVWQKTTDRNEVLDTSCYAFAALEVRHVNLGRCAAAIQQRAQHEKRVPEPPTVIVGAPAPAVEPVAKVAEPAASAPGRFKKPPRYPEMGPRFGGGSGWVNNWKQF